jgi:hypothetical protein
MAYAEHLMADPSQWRLAVRYLSHCGPMGIGTAKQILSHLPFRLPASLAPDEPQTSARSASSKSQQSPLPELDEVLSMCAQLDLHDAQQEICRVCARPLSLNTEPHVSTDCSTETNRLETIWEGGGVLCQVFRCKGTKTSRSRPCE